jgi:hypothetical protein
VAFDGDTVAVNVDVPPTINDKLLELSETPVTGMITVTTQVAVLLPSIVITFMVALPPAIAVTVPLLFIVATLVLSELQVTDGFVAFDGDTVAVNDDVLPTVNNKLAELSETPVTGMVTVTAQLTE